MPDVNSKIDTLGKQKVNYKTFSICPKVSLEFVDSQFLTCPASLHLQRQDAQPNR